MEEKKKGFIKKFVNEFKAFALKGNVMDLAVGVIIGAAFQGIVTSFTENFINPIIGCIGGAVRNGRAVPYTAIVLLSEYMLLRIGMICF